MNTASEEVREGGVRAQVERQPVLRAWREGQRVGGRLVWVGEGR